MQNQHKIFSVRKNLIYINFSAKNIVITVLMFKLILFQTQGTNVDTVSSLVRNESFSSRRSSIDDAILWIHKNSSGDVLKGICRCYICDVIFDSYSFMKI